MPRTEFAQHVGHASLPTVGSGAEIQRPGIARRQELGRIIHIAERMHEIRDGDEVGEVQSVQRPIPRLAIPQKRASGCLIEASPLRFTRQQRTELFTGNHTAYAGAYQSLRTPWRCHVA